MNYKILAAGLLLSFSAYSQVECPELDFCFPETHGHNFDVPSPLYPTIEAAVQVAPPGSNIRIGAGVYTTNVIVNKNLNFVGNHAQGRPTIIQAYDTTMPIFYIQGSPLVEFRKMQLRNSSSAIGTDFFQNGPYSSVSMSDLIISNVDRGVAGAYENVEITKSELLGGQINGLSFSRIKELLLKHSIIRNFGGYGLYIHGSPGGAIGVSNTAFEHNSKGGMIVKFNPDGVIINRVIARNNGVAGVILDHTGPSYVEKSDLSYNRTVDGKFGNGLLVYSSNVHAWKNTFIDNGGFETGLVGCYTPASEMFRADFSDNYFHMPEISGPTFTVFAMYTTTGCASSPGSLTDGGGNKCNGTSACAAASSGGLEPIPVSL